MSRHDRRRLWGATLASLVSLAILVSLGTWQLARREWKHGLIAQIETRAHGAPAAVPDAPAWPTWSAAEGEFQRVLLDGVFDHAHAVAIHGLMHDRPGRPVQGYYVLTPLRRDDGSVVLVNRGFVPPALKDEAAAPGATPRGRVAVTGLMRASETRGWFVPENGPGGWFVRNVDEIARSQGLTRVAPFYVDQDAGADPAAWPRGGQTRLVLADNHLQYALTWFGLAATLVGVFGAFAWRSLRGSGDDLEPDDPGQDQPDAAEPDRVRRIAE